MSFRIPFEEAISKKGFLYDHFYKLLSFPQQTVLLAFYGLPLGEEKDNRGFSRVDYFWASQGYGHYDDLGYLTGVDIPGPYVPQKYRELWMIAGVRSGKSLIADTATVYEATCGGHEATLRPGTRAYCFQVAQDLRSAKKAILSIKSVLDSIPFLSQPYTGPGNFDGFMVDKPLVDKINLWNSITIMTMPPTVKSIRGYDSPCAVLDEIGVWPTDKDQANVDTEVYDQATSRQAQFDEPKIFGLSSPWIMSGMLYDKWAAGTNGCKVFCSECEPRDHADRPKNCLHCIEARIPHQGKLIFHLPTAAFNNPLVKDDWLRAKKATNPQNFRRECMAEFMPTTASFLDPAYVEECVSRGISERAPVKADPNKSSYVPYYVAALDPGFKRDSFGFGIGHTDQEGNIVIDVIRQWKPVQGQPLSPDFVLKQITPLMRAYGCISAMSDQYHFESLQILAQQEGWTIEPVTFTGTTKNNIFGNLQTLVNLKKIKLLDRQEVTHELKSLQRILTPSGNVQISAPQGLHDDLAIIVALLSSRAVYLDPTISEPKKEETYYDAIVKQIERRKKMLREAEWYYDY